MRRILATLCCAFLLAACASSREEAAASEKARLRERLVQKVGETMEILDEMAKVDEQSVATGETK